MARGIPVKMLHGPLINRIGYSPNACKLVNYEGIPYQWVDTSTMPSQVRCDFDQLEYDEIVGNADDMRRYVHKYDPEDTTAALKQHCGQMVTVNGKTIPRYLHPSDTFCKSALKGLAYREFVNDICHSNLNAEYCACYNRTYKTVYAQDGNGVPDMDAACWYKPCVFNTGFKDPRLISECKTNVCPIVEPGSTVSICN